MVNRVKTNSYVYKEIEYTNLKSRVIVRKNTLGKEGPPDAKNAMNHRTGNAIQGREK